MWDYCVSDNFNKTWGPHPLPDRPIAVSARQVCSVVMFLGLVFFCYWCGSQVTQSVADACGHAVVLAHKFVVPAVWRLPGASRRYARILSWRLLYGYRHAVAYLAKLSRRISEARMELQRNLGDAWLTLQVRLGNLRTELCAWAFDTQRQVRCWISRGVDGVQHALFRGRDAISHLHARVMRQFASARARLCSCVMLSSKLWLQHAAT